jgi:Tol biopolymer transport system component
VKPASGTGEEEILFKDGTRSKYVTSWSPDGTSIIYQTAAPNPNLWVLPIVGERRPEPFLQTPFSELNARFSPNGRWVAFHSSESGEPELYVAPFPGPGQSSAFL